MEINSSMCCNLCKITIDTKLNFLCVNKTLYLQKMKFDILKSKLDVNVSEPFVNIVILHFVILQYNL